MVEYGNLVTIPFPFADQRTSKARPVLVISGQDAYGDFVCLAVTSRKRETNAVPLASSDMLSGHLPIPSWIRTDKVFTLNASLIIKVLGVVNTRVVEAALQQLCNHVGYQQN